MQIEMGKLKVYLMLISTILVHSQIDKEASIYDSPGWRDQTTGVFYDWGSTEGYNLLVPEFGIGSYIIDNRGKVLHEWKEPDGYGLGGESYLTEEGTLLRSVRVKTSILTNIFKDYGRIGALIREYDREGTCIWEFRLFRRISRIKGNIVILPNGNILISGIESKPYYQALNRNFTGLPRDFPRGYWSHFLMEVRRNGTENTSYEGSRFFDDTFENTCLTISEEKDIIWRWDSWDITIDALSPLVWDINKDYFDITSFDYLPDRDHIIIMCRPCGEVFIIDHGRYERYPYFMKNVFLYRWGNPANYGGRGPQRLSADNVMWVRDKYGWKFNFEGKVLVFNNEDPEQYNKTVSSIVQFDPPFYRGKYIINRDGTFGPRDFDFKVLMIQEKIDKTDRRFGALREYALGAGAQQIAYGNSRKTAKGLYKYPWRHFYSPDLGYVQKLPNNNLLVTSSNGVEAFELQLYDRAIWKYVSPFYNTGINNNVFGEDCVLGPKGKIPFCRYRDALCNSHSRLIKYSKDFKGFEVILAN